MATRLTYIAALAYFILTSFWCIKQRAGESPSYCATSCSSVGKAGTVRKVPAKAAQITATNKAKIPRTHQLYSKENLCSNGKSADLLLQITVGSQFSMSRRRQHLHWIIVWLPWEWLGRWNTLSHLYTKSNSSPSSMTLMWYKLACQFSLRCLKISELLIKVTVLKLSPWQIVFTSELCITKFSKWCSPPEWLEWMSSDGLYGWALSIKPSLSKKAGESPSPMAVSMITSTSKPNAQTRCLLNFWTLNRARSRHNTVHVASHFWSSVEVNECVICTNEQQKAKILYSSTVTCTCQLQFTKYHQPFKPFHSWEWSMSNFPSSPTRNIASHSKESLAFHSFLRWKMIIIQILATSLMHFFL